MTVSKKAFAGNIISAGKDIRQGNKVQTWLKAKDENGLHMQISQINADELKL